MLPAWPAVRAAHLFYPVVQLHQRLFEVQDVRVGGLVVHRPEAGQQALQPFPPRLPRQSEPGLCSRLLRLPSPRPALPSACQLQRQCWPGTQPLSPLLHARQRQGARGLPPMHAAQLHLPNAASAAGSGNLTLLPRPDTPPALAHWPRLALRAEHRSAKSPGWLPGLFALAELAPTKVGSFQLTHTGYQAETPHCVRSVLRAPQPCAEGGGMNALARAGGADAAVQPLLAHYLYGLCGQAWRLVSTSACACTKRPHPASTGAAACSGPRGGLLYDVFFCFVCETVDQCAALVDGRASRLCMSVACRMQETGKHLSVPAAVEEGVCSSLCLLTPHRGNRSMQAICEPQARSARVPSLSSSGRWRRWTSLRPLRSSGRSWRWGGLCRAALRACQSPEPWGAACMQQQCA